MHVYHDVHDGKCGICTASGTYLSKQKKTIDLSIDHEHLQEGVEWQRLAAQRGQIRGILCGLCNAEVDLSDLVENADHYRHTKGEEHYAKVYC